MKINIKELLSSGETNNTNLKIVSIDKNKNDIYNKNKILFTSIKNETVIVLTTKYLAEQLRFLKDNDELEKYDVLLVDQESFEELNSKVGWEQEEKKEETDEEDLESIIENQYTLSSEDSAPIIQFVNKLFYKAIKMKTSDIHIESHEKQGLIRFRIDGILEDIMSVDIKIMDFIISRLKVMSNLDISEKRLPQDGRTQISIQNKIIDIRISVIPTYYGEKVVMRMLMQSSEVPKLNKLGFNETLTNQFKSILNYSYGVILVTGPTGSGKSTTLHSFLNHIESNDKNIITIEDPIEYKSSRINQIQVNNKTGLTFAAGLRSILRQDPDIIMVGEIRDKETASIAIQAAQTGHLVFSTLHTNSATSSVIRLIDMGIEPFLITSSVIGILSQRLVRELCHKCKVIDKESIELFNQEKEVYKSCGCDECNNTGYKGRIAVGEFFKMDQDFNNLIKNGVDDAVLKDKFIEKGNLTLQTQLEDLVLDGRTSIQEIKRVGYANINSEK